MRSQGGPWEREIFGYLFLNRAYLGSIRLAIWLRLWGRAAFASL